MRLPINNIIKFVLAQSMKYNIDESHSLNHALTVLSNSKKIYDKEVQHYEYLKEQTCVIFTSALVHDICDTKYAPGKESLQEIESFLYENAYNKPDTDTILNIIDNMSYGKIKKNGFPNMGTNQKAFNIVREADLISAYDINRTVLYGIHKLDLDYTDSVQKSSELYFNRMDKHNSDNLFTTVYCKEFSEQLNESAKSEMKLIHNLIDSIDD